MHEIAGADEDPFINMADAVVDYILNEGAPPEIHVSNDIMAAALDHVCRVADIKLVRENKLKQTAGIAKDFIKMMKHR